MTNWIQNGGPVDTIAISDRGLLYGDGVFETIAIRRGEPRLWSYHLDRLTRSCKILELAMPAELDLLNGIELAIASSGVSSEYAVVKIMITAGLVVLYRHRRPQKPISRACEQSFVKHVSPADQYFPA
jgi:4-amino-4-deoxychorismate lyase